MIFPEEDGIIFPPVKQNRMCTSSSGTRFQSGDSWRVNACQSCKCEDGQIHCFSQACPLLTCNHTILKKGQCCPYCAGKSYEWQHPKTGLKNFAHGVGLSSKKFGKMLDPNCIFVWYDYSKSLKTCPFMDLLTMNMI